MESHLDNNPNFLPAWVDLDAFLLDPAAVMISTNHSAATTTAARHRHGRRPFVCGHEKHNIRIHCLGDVFALDQEAIHGIRKLESKLSGAVVDTFVVVNTILGTADERREFDGELSTGCCLGATQLLQWSTNPGFGVPLCDFRAIVLWRFETKKACSEVNVTHDGRTLKSVRACSDLSPAD